jgi:hypothetical protein
METTEIVDAVLNQDAEAFKSAFDNVLAQKVADALEVRKIEIASNLVAKDELPAEEIVDNDEE